MAVHEIPNLQNGTTSVDNDPFLSPLIDTVLGWKPEDGRDMAVSFEYASCLTDVWYAFLYTTNILYNG